jgi:uncharacterized protein (DUF1778 family)
MSDEIEVEVLFTDAEWSAVEKAAAEAGVTVEAFIVEAARVRAEESRQLLDEHQHPN